MDFTISATLQTALFYWPPKLVLNVRLSRRAVKLLLTLQSAKRKNFFHHDCVLDWMKARLLKQSAKCDLMRNCFRYDFVLDETKALICP